MQQLHLQTFGVQHINHLRTIIKINNVVNMMCHPISFGCTYQRIYIIWLTTNAHKSDKWKKINRLFKIARCNLLNLLLCSLNGLSFLSQLLITDDNIKPRCHFTSSATQLYFRYFYEWKRSENNNHWIWNLSLYLILYFMPFVQPNVKIQLWPPILFRFIEVHQPRIHQ